MFYASCARDKSLDLSYCHQNSGRKFCRFKVKLLFRMAALLILPFMKKEYCRISLFCQSELTPCKSQGEGCIKLISTVTSLNCYKIVSISLYPVGTRLRRDGVVHVHIKSAGTTGTSAHFPIKKMPAFNKRLLLHLELVQKLFLIKRKGAKSFMKKDIIENGGRELFQKRRELGKFRNLQVKVIFSKKSPILLPLG